MINYREILRLLSLGYTQHQIAASLHCSRNTVRDVKNASNKYQGTVPRFLKLQQNNDIINIYKVASVTLLYYAE